MNGYRCMSFSGQRILCFALVFGMTMYAIGAGVAIQNNEGVGLAGEPIEMLDSVVMYVGGAMAAGALAARMVMNKRAEARDGPDRSLPRFLSRIVPLAMLELGCLLAITTWMLNGTAVPSLVVACVLLSIAISMVPLQDPDADTTGNA